MSFIETSRNGTAIEPDEDTEDNDADVTPPKRRSIDPMLKSIDKLFAAFEDLPPTWRPIALTLINTKYDAIDDSEMDPRD